MDGHQQLLMQAFLILSNQRRVQDKDAPGITAFCGLPQCITLSEIKDYLSIFCIPFDDDYFSRCIIRIDQEYLNLQYSKIKVPKKPRKAR